MNTMSRSSRTRNFLIVGSRIQTQGSSRPSFFPRNRRGILTLKCSQPASEPKSPDGACGESHDAIPGQVSNRSWPSHSINLGADLANSLDDINEKVQKKAEDVGASICALPQPPSADVIVALTRRVDMFVTEIKSHLDGRPGRNTFQRAWNQIAQEFRVVMESSQPDICFGSKRQSYISSTPKGDNGPKPGTSITSTPTRRVQRAESTKVINLDEHPPALSPQAASAARKRNGGSVPETPRKRPKQNELHEHRDTNEVKG